MSEYYCLVAGLPEVNYDGSKQMYSTEKFREEIYPALSSEDARAVDLYYLGIDNENILKIIASGEAAVIEKTGCFSREELFALFDEAKEGFMRSKEVPAYIYDFLEYYEENQEQKEILWSDKLNALYFNYAVDCPNKFISEWYAYNRDVNNVLVALLARKYKLNIAECIVGEGEIAEALCTSNARDFGLTGSVEWLEQVMRMSENDALHEREHQLDDMRWAWLDNNSVFNYFTIERLFVFLQKLSIVERWARLDAEKGMQRYKELIADLKGGKIVTEDINNR